MLGKWNATYFVRAGVVRIISLDDVQNGSGFFARKVFDVDDLLGAINQWNHLHQLELKKPEDAAAPETPASESPNANHSSSDNSHLIVRASAAAGQHGGPGNGFRAPVVWRRSLAGYQLTDLIYQSVDGDQWLVSGSGNATMSLVCGHLVVYGPETLISDIDELLSDLKGKLATD